MKQLTDMLRQHHLRVTQPRLVVFKAFKKSAKPLSLNDIIAACRYIDRASVYRTIDTYIAIGVVRVVPIGWKKQYELTDIFSPHHHHLHCIKCGQFIPINDDTLEEKIASLAAQYRFQPTSHHFEIEGVCEHCQLK